jgi:hypothetical protein
MSRSIRRVASPADRDNRRKPIRIRPGERPCSRAPHAEPGQINPVFVNPVFFDQVVEKRIQGHRVPAPARSLRRDDDKGKLFPFGDQLRRPVFFRQFEIVSAFTAAM